MAALMVQLMRQLLLMALLMLQMATEALSSLMTLLTYHHELPMNQVLLLLLMPVQ